MYSVRQQICKLLSRQGEWVSLFQKAQRAPSWEWNCFCYTCLYFKRVVLIVHSCVNILRCFTSETRSLWHSCKTHLTFRIWASAPSPRDHRNSYEEYSFGGFSWISLANQFPYVCLRGLRVWGRSQKFFLLGFSNEFKCRPENLLVLYKKRQS